MPNTPPLSQILLELSDAIEELALLLAKQKAIDNEVFIKQFSLLAKKHLTYSHDNTTEKTISPARIKSKHRKDYLRNWLKERKIFVGKAIDNLRVDEELYRVADFLTDHYRQLESFYKQLKRNQNIKKDFIARTNNSTIRYIRWWAEMLYKNKLIDSFDFLDKNQIDIDIAQIHKATYFINGYWLEILLRRELAKILRANFDKIHSFDVLTHVELVKPTRKSSELDLLLMLNNEVYWFECKSGDIGKYYKVFDYHHRLLRINPEHSLLVVPMMKMHQAQAAMKNAGMTMLYATELDLQLPLILFSNSE